MLFGTIYGVDFSGAKLVDHQQAEAVEAPPRHGRRLEQPPCEVSHIRSPERPRRSGALLGHAVTFIAHYQPTVHES